MPVILSGGAGTRLWPLSRELHPKQLLALASGARTVKMKFGHHGANHPVLDTARGTVMITSQNHGFAADEATLPPTLHATHRSLFDGSLQGHRA